MSRRFAGIHCLAFVVLTFSACLSDYDDESQFGQVPQAVAQVAISHITFGTIGLDSNNVSIGPNVFPVGVRITNNGDATATDLTATFAFTTANANINLDGPATVSIASLAPGAHADAYFNVLITRTVAAHQTSRQFRVTVSGTGFATATSPGPREVYVEELVSQSRNSLSGITGPTAVALGETRTYEVDIKTAPGGYEQVEAFLTFPASMFQVISTATTYTAPAGATSDTIYADACGWDPVPTSPTYRSCIGPENFAGGKAGDTIHTIYTVKVIGSGTANVTAAIYDFSGSSYHYNADFGESINVVVTSVPIATDDSYTTAEDAPLAISAPGVLANDNDPGGAGITAILVSSPLHGTVTLSGDGSFAYTPDPDYNGPDSFTYKVNNGLRDSSIATVSIDVTPVNDPPNASDDSASVVENSGATLIDVLANDTGAPDTGETLTVTSVTQPTGGTVVIAAGGTGLTFQPDVGFTGTATFTYTISDGNGGTDTATVTVTVTRGEVPPTAADNTVTVAEDSGPTAIDVLANDSDGNGDPLTITGVTQPGNGTVVITGGGTGVTFQPDADFNGTTTFTYTISDGKGGTDTATVTVNVTPVNDPPSASDDIAAVAEDTGATAIDVLGNDTIAPDAGEILTIASVTQPGNGTVVITGGGTGLTFQPDANFNGTTTFTYTISDGNGGTATATVTVTMTPVNDPPIAVDDSATVAEDSGATAIDVLGNDTIAPDAGEILTITAATQPADGTVVITGGGTGLSFQPNANFTGTTTFTYTISDGNGGTATATVTVDVTPVNDPPTANDDIATVAEDAGPTAIDVLGNDTIAPDAGEILTITAVTQPANGTVVITGGGTGLTFQPDADFTGTTTFTYTISDGNGGATTATVTVTVIPVNDPPSANDDTATVTEDAAATVIDVLRNDTIAPDAGEILTITVVTQPTNGTVVITGGGTGVTFQPSADFTGTTTFTYTISDGNGGTATATVTVDVTPVNDPPSANDDTATVDEDAGPTAIAVLGNDTIAPDAGEILTITAVTQPANGTVVITGGGTGVTFQPDADFTGTTTFTYTISDGNGGTDTATVTVNVGPINDPPSANDDTATVAEDAGPTAIDVLVNDTIAPDAGEILAITSVTQPANGTVVITGGGTGVTFQPSADFTGTTTFTYTISDGNGGTATATVTVTVTPVNDPPRASDDTATVAEDSGATAIDVLVNDSDVEGDTLTVTAVTQPADGTVVITGGGTGLTFQPTPDFNGTTTFTYTISDGNGGTATATVTITVTPVEELRVSGGGCQASGSDSAASGGLVVLIGWLVIALGRRRRWRMAHVVVLGLAVAPAAARADEIEPRNFSVERFHLAADRNGLFNVDWAEHPGDNAIDVALVTGLIDDPLVVYKSTQDNDRMIIGALVDIRATANLVGSIVLHRYLSVGADLPLVVYQDRPSMNQLAPSGLESISSFGLGNIRATPKVTLFTQSDRGVGLAVLAAVTLPTASNDDAYFGDHGVSIAPMVALSRRFGAWRTGLNLGYLARQQAKMLDLTVDDEVFARAGASYDLPGRKLPVSIDLTLSAATAAADFGGHVNINYLEPLLGVTYQIDPRFQLFGGAGAGLAHGFGAPDARVMLGVRLTRGGGHEPPKPVLLDRDHDGILDAADPCPTDPEDMDSFEDADGCPEPDNDKDGMLDAADSCPLDPGIAELKGCPAKDSDVDGLADHLDQCPTDPEDVDSFQDADGCPDPDNDKDGVLEPADGCPMEAGPETNKGCPEPDSDGDTVIDRLDNCPTEKGLPENAGCPKQQLVKITDEKIDILESVYFKLNKAIIEKRSYALLDNVAAVLANHSNLVIQVEGHTDGQGNDAYNLTLSQRRAQAVADYLVKKGIDKARLQHKGFGETVPIADNQTKDGRAQNRRVVFTIIGANNIQNKQQGADDSMKEK
jgi:outer membrane protein OmpA-like peptidoglycan-associated protein